MREGDKISSLLVFEGRVTITILGTIRRREDKYRMNHKIDLKVKVKRRDSGELDPNSEANGWDTHMESRNKKQDKENNGIKTGR